MRTAHSMLLALAIAPLGACSLPIDKTNLRVDNRSTTPVRVDAWTRPPATAAAIAPPESVILEPGAFGRIRLGNPPGEVNPPLTIRVQPTAREDLPGIQGKPIWLELAPPEPFRIVVEGEPGELTVRRR